MHPGRVETHAPHAARTAVKPPRAPTHKSTAMSLPLLLRHPRLQPWSLRIDRAPAALWLVLQTAALWPTWRWMAARLQDGSDDPLGLLALGALIALVFALRRDLRAAPRLPWLLAALAGTLAATLWRGEWRRRRGGWYPWRWMRVWTWSVAFQRECSVANGCRLCAGKASA